MHTITSFFAGIFLAIGSLFGYHSHAVQPVKVPVDIAPVITYPLGGETLLRGHTYTLTWVNKDPVPRDYFMDLIYVNGGLYFNSQRIDPASSTQQSFTFKVATDTTPLTNYQVYFYDNKTNESIVGSNAFTIK